MKPCNCLSKRTAELRHARCSELLQRKEIATSTFNGNSRFHSAKHLVDERFDAFKAGMQHLVERVMSRPEVSSSRVRRWSTQATDTVKAYPYVALGIALGLGYAIVRIARR